MGTGSSNVADAQRELTGEKAQRIVTAMRAAVAERGVAGATFDHVARAAGVSRGLLHYYFGTKERLLVEALRNECDLRIERVELALRPAETVDDVLRALLRSLEDMVQHEPDFTILFFELTGEARRNDELASALAALGRRIRVALSELLAIKRDESVLNLKAPPDAVAGVLLGLADGLALQMLAQRDHDWAETIAAALHCARALLADQ